MNLPNFKKIRVFLACITIIFSLISYLYVRAVLEENNVDVIEDNNENSRADDVKPVKVTLIIRENGRERSFEKNMYNTHKVSDLLREVKNTENFTFEKTAYIYGTELSEVNGLTAPENMRWTIYMSAEPDKIDDTKKAVILSDEEERLLNKIIEQGRSDITFELENASLVNRAVYELELSPK